jgi:hypothetical protein
MISAFAAGIAPISQQGTTRQNLHSNQRSQRSASCKCNECTHVAAVGSMSYGEQVRHAGEAGKAVVWQRTCALERLPSSPSFAADSWAGAPRRTARACTAFITTEHRLTSTLLPPACAMPLCNTHTTGTNKRAWCATGCVLIMQAEQLARSTLRAGSKHLAATLSTTCGISQRDGQTGTSGGARAV